MTFSTLRPTLWLLFRACVTLRQILALRKPRPMKRARKAAAICGICLAAIHGAFAREPTAPPALRTEPAIDTIGLAEVRIRPLREIGTTITPPAGELPANLAQIRFANAPLIVASEFGGRGWSELAYLWYAPAISYRPLYLEETNLERYGHSAGCIVQPVVSAAHFLTAVPLLPVKLAIERPWNCIYPLGHARPGSPAPWELPR